MYNSLCISDCAFEGYPVPLHGDTKENILTAKEIGFPAVEMHVAWPFDYDWESWAEFCAGAGMKISTFGTGLSAGRHGVNLVSFDDYIARKSQDVFKEFIRAGSVTGANVIFGSMKGTVPGGYTMDAYFDLLYERMMSGVELCEKLGVNLVIEAINRYETKIMNTGDSVLEFIRRFDSERVFVHVDTFHMNIEERDMADCIRACGSKLGHIHFADSNRHYPGAGHIDFRKVVEALQEIGYEGPCAFEYLPLPNGLEAAQKGYAYMNTMVK
ncbi:MAG: TIM barrel protein [Christensenellales bacterium]|jgi:sugar phosphate isomerase/epimerase